MINKRIRNDKLSALTVETLTGKTMKEKISHETLKDIDNAKLSNIVESRREAKREMKNDAANKRAVEESTRNYTVSLAPREFSDVQSNNGFAICDNGSIAGIAGTICDNELTVVSLQKPIPN